MSLRQVVQELQIGGTSHYGAMPCRPVRGQSLYPHLLSPLKVGRNTLRNRMIMGSMHTRLDMEENGLHKMAVFLAERAKG